MFYLTKQLKRLFNISGGSGNNSKMKVRQDSMLALITDIIMESDSERIYTWSNQPGYDFFGNDVIGKKADSYFVDKQDIDQVLQPLSSGEEETIFIESWQRRKDGQKRLLAWWCRSIKTESGKVIGTLAIARDITGAKNNEFNLLARTIELESFFNYSIELLCIVDTDGYFRRLSQHWVEVLGYPLKDLIGQKYIDFVHPDDVEGTLQQSTNVGNLKNTTNYVNRYRHKDGSFRWLEWSSVTLGKTVYASARDITEQKRTEQILRLSEARYSHLVQNSPIVNYQLDRNGFFLQSEGKGLSGLNLKPGQVVGQSVYDVYKDYPIVYQSFEKALSGENVNFQAEVLNRYFDSFLEPVFDSFNQITSVIGVSVDVTERYRAEAETKRLNLALEQRVASRTAQLASINNELAALDRLVSHDLKAPINAHDRFPKELNEQGQKHQDSENERLFLIVKENIPLMEKMIAKLVALSKVSENDPKRSKS